MMGMGVLELRGEEEEERFGDGKSSSLGRNMNMNVKGSFLCMPRLRSNRVRVSLLERFRAAVFKLIMLSAKGGDASSCGGTAATARPRTHHQYSSSQYYSEAVADCIEFIKKSAMDDDDSSIPTRSSDQSLQTSSTSCHLCRY